MADLKITQLTELSTIANDDVLAIVDDTGGTPVTKKVTVNNLQTQFVIDASQVNTGSPTFIEVTTSATAQFLGYRGAQTFMGNGLGGGTAVFSHLNMREQANGFAIRQISTGSTTLNSQSGQDLNFAINAAAKMILDSGGDFTVYATGAESLIKSDWSAGNVGIGTASPSEKLDVVGNIQTSGRVIGPVEHIPFTVNGGGSTITTGYKGEVPIPHNSTITGFTAYADTTGTLALDIYNNTYGNFGSTAGGVVDTITLAGERKSRETGLSISGTAGNLWYLVVSGTPANITKVTYSIDTQRA